MQLCVTLLGLRGIGNGVRLRSVVRNAMSVAVMICNAVLCPALMPSVAWADEDSVVSVDIEVLGWKFTPIIQNGFIKGFFAQISPEILVEGNLETIWFEQDENGDWLASSWSGSGTATNALGWVRSHFADPEIFSLNLNLHTQAPELTFAEETLAVSYGDWVAPIALDGGLLENDPLQLLLGDGPRTLEMFQMLAYNGWPVAPELSPLCSAHHGDNCGSGSDETTLHQLLVALAAETPSLMDGLAANEGDTSIFDYFCWCTKELGPLMCDPIWHKVLNQNPIDVGHLGYNVTWEKNCMQHWRKWGDHFYICTDCTDDGWERSTKTQQTYHSPFQVGEDISP
jgi:hypothetical protein